MFWRIRSDCRIALTPPVRAWFSMYSALFLTNSIGMNRDILKILPYAELKIVTDSIYLVIMWIPHTVHWLVWNCTVLSFPWHDSIILSTLDKRGYLHNIFLFLYKNICCGYSLEEPQRGASNEHPQHMLLLRNKKNISNFWLKKSLIWSYTIYNMVLI